MRVERGIVGALAEPGGPRMGFVVFDWAMGRFQTLSAHEASRIVTAPTRPERDRELASVWKRRLWGMQARLRRFWPSASPANFAGPGVAEALAAGGATVPTLVIVGRIDLERNALVRSVGQDPRLRGLIRFMPNANDAVLLWLYRNCRYTVFSSLQEGFGLPVAESLSHGKVCLASSGTSIPEAGQGAAIALDPADAATWAAEVTRLNDDTALAEEQARVTRLFRPVTWSDTAEEIVSVLTRQGHLGGEPACSGY